MPFRSNRPARLGLSNDDATRSDDHELPRSPLRQSVQALSHQQIVSQRLLQRDYVFANEGPDMFDPKKTLNRTASSPDVHRAVDPKASTSTVNVIVNQIESRVDVGQAISLLQELKKTASPDELVALHRALLPVKEPSPQPSSEQQMYSLAPPERRRSVLPPGLATRSSSSEDVLRKPPNSAPLETPTRTPTKSESRINGDLYSSPPHRLGTPAGPYLHAGAFQSGTLRITNGAASPEPSIVSKLARSASDASENVKECIGTGGDALLQPEIANGVGSTPRPAPLRTHSDGLEVVRRPSGPRPQSLDTIRGRARERRQLQLDRPLEQLSLPDEGPNPQDELQARRATQILHHRAAHLSQEYLLDCDITGSPYEEKDGLLGFSHRLSTVHDEEPEPEADTHGGIRVHVRTLSKLTGVLDDGENSNSHDVGSAQINDDGVSIAPHALTTGELTVRKKDSGYCSDASAQQELTSQAPGNGGAPAEAIDAQPSSNSSSEQGTVSSSTEPASLATLEDMLASAPTTGPNTPTSVDRKKSSLSLFKSKSKSKQSFVVLNVEHGSKSPATPNPKAEKTPKRDHGQTSEGKQRKLQKPVPEEVRRQRKKTLENLREQGISKPMASPKSTSAEGTHHADVRGRTDGEETPSKRGSDDQTRRRSSTDAVQDISPKSLRKRGKSFGRRRTKTVSEAISLPIPTPDYSAPIPVGSTASLPCQSSHPTSNEAHTPSPTPSPPSHASFASVAKALSSHPPTVEEKQESKPRPKSMQRYYSVHRINPDTNAFEQPSADSQTAEAVSTCSPATPVSAGSQLSVEDRFPGWQGKPTTADGSPTTTAVSPSASSNSLVPSSGPSRRQVEELVPPLPELPADIEAKVSKVDQMLAKKYKISPGSSPIESARSSIDNAELSRDRYETIRKDNLTKIALLNEQESARVKRSRAAAFEQLNQPLDTDLEVPAVNGGVTQRWSIDGTISLPSAAEPPRHSSPTHDSQHPGWPGWETQSHLWRQRRETLSRSLAEPVEFEDKAPGDDPEAPPIYVSRYITPLGHENVHNANKANDTPDVNPKFTRSQSDLGDYEKENIPIGIAYDDLQTRADHLRSQSSFSVVSRSSVMSHGSWSTGRLPYSPVSPTSPTSQVGHVRTKSGRFIPYRPGDAAQAERSRALSLARRSTYIAESSQEHLPLPSRPDLQKSSSETLFDRYSGGLNYGWDRDAGFNGSAGTRSKSPSEAMMNRKSVKMSEDFGLDLTDVPVFLAKAEQVSFSVKKRDMPTFGMKR